jgi:hypothetical protein
MNDQEQENRDGCEMAHHVSLWRPAMSVEDYRCTTHRADRRVEIFKADVAILPIQLGTLL